MKHQATVNHSNSWLLDAFGPQDAVAAVARLGLSVSVECNDQVCVHCLRRYLQGGCCGAGSSKPMGLTKAHASVKTYSDIQKQIKARVAAWVWML